MTHTRFLIALAGFFAAGLITARAALASEAQAKVDALIPRIQALAADPTIVEAVAAQNRGLSPEQTAMTQELWSRFNNRQTLVQALTTNAVAEFLRANAGEWMCEAFVSDARGFKVGFLSKPSNWSHAGKPKHEEAMTGRVWQGSIEIDPSSGRHQLQISVPVLKDGTPIGSLVVGIAATSLL